MILKSLYSEPRGLFKNTPKKDGKIHFKLGMNFILGKKDSQDTKQSLNGIGKSLLLDLIDFCLLSSFDSKNVRLYEAKDHLSGYTIVLEFEISEKVYLLKRSVDEPSTVYFGPTENLITYKLSELNPTLCDLIFFRKGYDGIYSNKWLRKLIPFFLKIHRDKQKKFSDPIDYLTNCTPLELNQYHLYLLGISNRLSQENYEIQSAIKDKTKAIVQVKEIVSSSYKIENIADVSGQVDRLTKEIAILEGTLSHFNLEPQYDDASDRANQLTEKIKSIVLKNHSDKEKISTYEMSLKTFEDKISVRKITKLYEEANELLGKKIEKTLDDALDFRKQLAKSRENFLKKEMLTLNGSISERTVELSRLDIERAKIFEFLNAKKALKDLNEAYLLITRKKDEISQLESKTRVYFDLSKEKAQLKTKEKAVEEKVLDFIESTKIQVAEFRTVFNKIYEAIYSLQEDKDEAKFRFYEDLNKEQKIIIDVVVPAMRSEGKNQGRTLVYDLAVENHLIVNRFPGPHFLAHDGIFDGVDKSHFVSVCNLINSLVADGIKIQYIIPINEEGTLSNKFGNVDDLTNEKIELDAIVVLTPSKRLLGANW